MKEYDETASFEKDYTVWFWILLLGVVLILIGAGLRSQNLSLFAGEVTYGFGISLFTASLLKVATDLFGRVIYKKWQRNHIEIFSLKRKNAGQLYKKEDGKAEKTLQLLSFSAHNALDELMRKGNLHAALLEKRVDVEFLIIDPSCKAAKDRAKEDAVGNDVESRKVMLDCFRRTQDLFDKLTEEFEHASKCGTLEIRLMTVHPLITVYIRDDDVLIYGPYFSEARGDEYASIKIVKGNNPDYFEQYRRHYYTNWDNAKNGRLLRLDKNRSTYEFHKTLYNKICNTVEKELSKT